MLYRAYYTDGYDISDPAVLGDLVENVGLNREEAMSKLIDTEYIKHYEDEMKENERKGTAYINERERERKREPNGGRYFITTIIKRYNWSTKF